MLSPIFSTTPLSGKGLSISSSLSISRSSVAVNDRSHQWGGTHAAKMKCLRVSLVHPENPDILSKRFTGLQDFQN